MAMSFIVGKQLELSGSSSSYDLKRLWQEGDSVAVDDRQQQVSNLEDRITGVSTLYEQDMMQQSEAITQLQEQVRMMAENQQTMQEKLGVGAAPSGNESAPAQQEVIGQSAEPVPVP
jgi:TolA-binding protein